MQFIWRASPRPVTHENLALDIAGVRLGRARPGSATQGGAIGAARNPVTTRGAWAIRPRLILFTECVTPCEAHSEHAITQSVVQPYPDFGESIRLTKTDCPGMAHRAVGEAHPALGRTNPAGVGAHPAAPPAAPACGRRCNTIRGGGA